MNQNSQDVNPSDLIQTFLQTFKFYKTNDVQIEESHRERQPRMYSLQINGLQKYYSEETVDVILIYFQNNNKVILTNRISYTIDERQIRQLIFMTNVIFSYVKIAVIGKNSQGNVEILEIDKDYQNCKLYKLNFAAYLSNTNINQTDVLTNNAVGVNLANYTLQNQHLRLKMNILYRQASIEHMMMLSNPNQQDQVSIDNLIFSLKKNQNYQNQTGAGMFNLSQQFGLKLLFIQHNGMAQIKEQQVNIYKMDQTRFQTNRIQLQVNRDLRVVSFLVLYLEIQNKKLCLGYIPFNQELINNHSNQLIQEGQTIFGEKIEDAYNVEFVFIDNKMVLGNNQQQTSSADPMAQQQMNQQPQQIDNGVMEELEYLRNKVRQYESQQRGQQGQEQAALREEVFLQHLKKMQQENEQTQAQKDQEFQQLKQMIESMNQNQQQQQRQVQMENINQLENIVQVPHKHQQVMMNQLFMNPQTGVRDLDRRDKAVFLGQNVDLEMKDDYCNNSAIDINREYEDSKKNITFVIQFLGIQRRISQYIQNQQDQVQLPRKVYFTVNFYDFQQFKSDTFNISQASGILELDNIDSGKYRQSYTFKIDSSKYGSNITSIQKYYKQFVDYLDKKYINIDIWDQQSLFHFGNVQMRLKELLRQGNENATMLKECDIRDYTNTKIKGTLKIMMKVQATECEQINYVTNDKQQSQIGKKRKVKSEFKLELPNNYNYQQQDNNYLSSELMNDDQKRIAQKIMMFKQKQMMTNAAEDQRDLKVRNLYYIQQYRNEYKKELLKQIQEQFVEEERSVYMQCGVPFIESYKVTNNSGNEQLYKINIQDPDNYFLKRPEVMLVTNPQEWSKMCEKYDYPPPPQFNMLTDDGTFVLNRNESIYLLVKFLTFRQVNQYELDVNKDKQQEEYLQSRYITHRKVNVQLFNKMNQLIGGIQFNIKSRNAVIDQVLRFYCKENQPADDIKIYCPNHSIQSRNIHLTYPKATVSDQNDEEVSLQITTMRQGTITVFNMLIYEDIYQSRLLNNMELQVYSLQNIRVKLNIGKPHNQVLPYKNEVPRICKLFTTSPLLVSFPVPFNNQFSLNQGSQTNIMVSLRSFHKLVNEQILVNCIDISSHELIYSWLLEVDTGEFQPNKIHNFKVGRQQSASHTIEFQNINKLSSMFKIFTNSSIIQISSEAQVMLKEGEITKITLKVAPLIEDQSAYVFIQNDDATWFNCYLVHVTVEDTV